MFNNYNLNQSRLNFIEKIIIYFLGGSENIILNTCDTFKDKKRSLNRATIAWIESNDLPKMDKIIYNKIIDVIDKIGITFAALSCCSGIVIVIGAILLLYTLIIVSTIISVLMSGFSLAFLIMRNITHSKIGKVSLISQSVGSNYHNLISESLI